MLPPALVDVAPGMTVLDMCAAPGSKTTQLVERLGSATQGSGVVVANDADVLRAYTLVKRTASLGARAAAMVVVNHWAQKLPKLEGSADGGGGFDRIVCDVPCTGDGTARKHPEVFQRWEPHRPPPAPPTASDRHARCCPPRRRRHHVLLDVLAQPDRERGRRCRPPPPLRWRARARRRRRRHGVEARRRLRARYDDVEVLGPQLTRHPSAADLQASDALTAGEKRLFAPSMAAAAGVGGGGGARKCVRLLPHLSDSGGFLSHCRKRRRLPRHPRRAGTASRSPPPRRRRRRRRRTRARAQRVRARAARRRRPRRGARRRDGAAAVRALRRRAPRRGADARRRRRDRRAQPARRPRWQRRRRRPPPPRAL